MKPENPKRKLLKDRDFPGPEQINKYQDFDRVFNNYGVVKKLLLKKGFLWTGAVIGTALVAGAAYLGISNVSGIKTNDAQVSIAPVETFVQPPIPGKEIAYAVYRVSSRDGGVLNFPTGSSITIPPNAFYLASGENIGDSIEIKYREFHNPLDIFLSGVPMEYDSAGLVRTLESAGMLEILASDQGKALTLNPGKPIEIKMASLNNEKRFNLYELDTVKKTWVYKGKDELVEPVKMPVPRHFEPSKEKEPAPEKTIRPALADPQKFRFTINYDKKDFPELEAYDDVQFEVTDNHFKPVYYKINWKKITLHCTEKEGVYTIRLIKADTTISLEARPVFEQENYEAALKKFEARHLSASEQREVKDKEAQKAVDEVNHELASYNSRAFIGAAFENAGISVAFRKFTIQSLGYHNIDFPIPPVLSYAYNLLRAVQDKSTSSPGVAADRKYNDIYLVQKGRNAVFRFRRGEPLRLNPNEKNLVWTLTNQGQVAFFRISDYTKLMNGGDNTIAPEVAPDQTLAFQEIRNFSGRAN
jgi:hypothetical protein